MVFGITVEAIISLIQQYGVLAVIFAALIEEVIVPIPSPIVPMAAGALLIEAADHVTAAFKILLLVAIPASVASVISSYMVYSIAYYGGKPAIQKYGRFLDFTWEEVQGLEKRFGDDYEKYYVAGFRAIPLVPLSMVSGAAGIFRMDWKKYGLWSLVGMLPRNFGLAMLGWYFADDFVSIANQIDSLSMWVTVGIVGLVGGYILYKATDRAIKRWLLD